MKTGEKKPKSDHWVGMEHDHLNMRGARLAADGKGGFAIVRMEEAHGDFTNPKDLAEGFRILKGKLGMTSKDSLVTCLSGKQTFASQLTFRKLPPEEMAQALMLELRKSVPFEITGATLDYSILSAPDAKGETIQVLVGVAAAGMLSRHLSVLEDAGLNPASVDILPVAVANALWTLAGTSKPDAPKVAVHIGPQMSTIVMDGPDSPFFTRYIYFAAEEILAGDGSQRADHRAAMLVDEIARSIAFYEKSVFAAGIQEVLLLGDFLDSPLLEAPIRQKTGLKVRIPDIPKQLGHAHSYHPGRFDLAATLAIRGGRD